MLAFTDPILRTGLNLGNFLKCPIRIAFTVQAFTNSLILIAFKF